MDGQDRSFGPAGRRIAGRGLSLTARRTLATWLLLLPVLVFLGGCFLAPLAQLLALSLSGKSGMLSAYVELAESEVFVAVFLGTLKLAMTVTVVCVLLAYPTAYLLSRLEGRWLTVALYCVLVPFWISVLVRTFSWMLLLERNGPVNTLLLATGIVRTPVKLLFNDFGVHLGMVHVLLAYAVLPIYAAMLKIDPRLLQASDGLGASAADTFRRIYLPLTLSGVAAGAVFVFLLSLGFYITPALLGGLHNLTVAMLIDNFVNERLVWPLAAAASFLLLAIILAILAVTARFIPLRQIVEAR
jgi:putative spermidine/putrescine transport system permease protein